MYAIQHRRHGCVDYNLQSGTRAQKYARRNDDNRRMLSARRTLGYLHKNVRHFAVKQRLLARYRVRATSSSRAQRFRRCTAEIRVFPPRAARFRFRRGKKESWGGGRGNKKRKKKKNDRARTSTARVNAGNARWWL